MRCVVYPEHPKRLQTAIDILSNLKLPKNADFNMDTWGTHGPGHAPTKRNMCGTAACAWGWIALSPKVKRLGVETLWRGSEQTGYSIAIYFDGARDFDAAQRFFGIGPEVARWLFIPEHYDGKITPKRVARRMEKVLAGLEGESHDVAFPELSRAA